MGIALTLTLSSLNLITTILHTFGGYLLIYQYRHGLQDSHELFLINLSISEGIVNLLQFLINPISDMISMSTNHALVINKVQHYIKTLRGVGFVTVYFLTMIYLTLDRLFDILLNIRYSLYWNELYTKNLLKVTWAMSISTAITVSVVYHYTGVDFHVILDLCVYPTFDIVFIIIAVLTYGFIFHKYKQTRNPPTENTTTTSNYRRPNILRVFQKSRFYIPVLSITTFIVFVAIPEMIHLWLVVIKGTHFNPLKTILAILWALSYFSDAVLYIWMKPSVKRLLLRKLRICWREKRIHPHLEVPVTRGKDVAQDNVNMQRFR